MKSIRAQTQVYDQDQSVILSPLEYSLFQWLKLHRGDVISRETLLKNVWGFQSNGDCLNVCTSGNEEVVLNENRDGV